MSNLVYAAAAENSPHAGAIGWVDFTNITIRPGAATRSMEVTAKDGSIITFDLTCTFVSGTKVVDFKGKSAPSFNGAAFGEKAYKTPAGVGVILYDNNASMAGVIRFAFNNILVKDHAGNPVSDFSVVVADGERTNTGEKIVCTTDGTVWSLLFRIPLGTTVLMQPDVLGLDTTIVTMEGNGGAAADAPIITTNNPQNILVDLGSGNGKQGFLIGFVVTSVTLRKDIVKRIDSRDQFQLSISGTKTSNVVTTGNAEGIQTEVAQVHLIDGSAYTINESFIGYGTSAFTDYRQLVTAVNLAEGGSSPPVGELPTNNTVVWGDMIQYTIQNRPNMSDVWIEKWAPYQSLNAGETIIYVIVIGNDGPDDAANVEIIDTMNTDLMDCMYEETGEGIWRDWAGRLNIGTLLVGQKTVYYLRGTIKSESRATQLTNTASITTINYDPNLLNNEDSAVFAVTQSANIVVRKIVDQAEATRGSWITYTLEIENMGPSDIDHVAVTDTIPAGLEQVQYSLDLGTNWEAWAGTYTISSIRNGETIQILIKGFITF